ncbi:hypothetical protein HDC90_000195 [Pedobacter sp. AK013]|uniref:hypothetical protein n=1 Tax=Pedobacter sp. AK013 TaxID=2723071 RepID=UPI00161C1E97|nr:hypothetical protein [Pedobacter sp. AK013]MBB6235598.1 hypothetical protein [Pedobacter sp. AK013]
MADKINTIYIKYLILTVIYLVLLAFFGEYYFFIRFNIEILNFDDFADLLLSQRGLSHWEKCIFLIFLPFIITAGFIIHYWIYDITNQLFTRNFAFLIGVLPFTFLPFLISFQDIKLSLVLFGITLLLSLLLWIILFHVRMFQFSYLSFHLFTTCCLITTFVVLARIDLEAQNCLSNKKNTNILKNLNEPSVDNSIIFIGNTTSFDFYYSPTQQRSIILPKTN